MGNYYGTSNNEEHNLSNTLFFLINVSLNFGSHKFYFLKILDTTCVLYIKSKIVGQLALKI